MENLIGTYECKADSKGRIMLPSGLKISLKELNPSSFVVKRSVFQPCLELYPMIEWNVLMKKLNNLNRFKKKNNDFIRLFTAGVKVVEVDATGRLLIPKNLCEFASIKKNVVLSSTINIIEIWDKHHYEKAIDESATDFGHLAEEVMGNFDANDELS